MSWITRQGGAEKVWARGEPRMPPPRQHSPEPTQLSRREAPRMPQPQHACRTRAR